MNFVNFVNNNSSIIQIALSFFTLIVTFALSVVIYRLQRAHEKQTANENERRRRDTLSENAKIFLIDNQNETDYLPLCIMAANVNKYSKNIRKIYTHFKKCPVELQTEILKQQNIPLSIAESHEWIDRFIQKLVEHSKEYKLGRNLLYDGAKYFHRGLKLYGEHKTDEINTFIFDVPSMSKNPTGGKITNRNSFTLYVDRYLEFVLRDREDSKDKPELLPQVPPYDVLWEKQKLASCEEDVISFWAMETIISTCTAFFRHDIVGKDRAEWREIDSGNAQIETFEDLYYQALLILYTAYASEANPQAGNSQKR